MHFVRLGEFLAASRITGPKHNLLQIRLGSAGGPPVCERLPAKGGCKHAPLTEDQLGAAYAVSHIRYIENDTPPEVVYGFMAMRIVEHLHNGGEFTQGASAGL